MSDWASVAASSLELDAHLDDVSVPSAAGANYGIAYCSGGAAILEAGAGNAEEHVLVEGYDIDYDLASFAEPKKSRIGRPPKAAQQGMSSGDLSMPFETSVISAGGACSSGAGLVEPHVFAMLLGLRQWQGSVPILSESLSMMVPGQQHVGQQVCDGYCLPSSLISPLACCAAAAAADDAIVDEDFQKLADSEIFSDGHHITSMVVCCERLGISRKVIEAKLWRLACAQWLACRFQRLTLEQELTLQLSSSHLLCYVESMSYDETPLKTPYKRLQSAKVAYASTSEMASETSQLVGVHKLDGGVRGDTVSSKVLQTRSHSALAFQVNGAPVTIIYDMVCPLQLLSTGSFATLLEAVHRNCPTSSWAKHFSMKSRVVAVDRNGANLKCEKFYVQDREAGWLDSVFTCEAHIAFGIIGSTLDGLYPLAVTGIISTALSLRHGNSLELFRNCLHEEVLATMVLKRGSPSPSAKVYKQNMMSLFMSGASGALLDAVLLTKLPNGDWRNHKSVEYYVPVGEDEPCRADVASMMSSTLVYVFLRSKPSIFQRHRWTGMDIAIEELARLQCCHGLLVRTYARFMRRLEAGGKTCSSGPGLPEQPLVVGAVADMPSDALVHDTAVGADPSEPNTDLAHVVLPHSNDAGQGPEEHRSAQLHAQDRQKAQAWLAGDPMSDLVLCRLTVDPLMGLMSMILTSSGQGWELEQRVQCLKHLHNPQEAPRLYNATVAANLDLEEEFYHDLQRWSNTCLWELVDEKSLKLSFNSLLFRMLSKQGCLVEQELRSMHQCFPFAMFQLLPPQTVEPDHILQQPECVLDEWSVAMRSQFPTLTGHLFQQCLEAHAMVISTSVAGIESRHSSVRRHLTVRSVQTHSLPAQSLSAHWVMQNIRAGVKLHGQHMVPSRAESQAVHSKENHNFKFRLGREN
eukprot:6488871-Amphidinium_carterae.6